MSDPLVDPSVSTKYVAQDLCNFAASKTFNINWNLHYTSFFKFFWTFWTILME